MRPDPTTSARATPGGPCYLAAQEAFKHALLEKDNLDTAGDGNTVRVILDSYLKHAETKGRASTAREATKPVACSPADGASYPAPRSKPFHAQTGNRGAAVSRRTSGKQRKQRVKWGDGSVRIFIQYLKAQGSTGLFGRS